MPSFSPRRVVGCCLLAVLPAAAATPEPTGPTVRLLDAELSRWEVFVGVPHTTVESLSAGTFQSDDVTRGQPLGLGAELPGRRVFEVMEEGGQPVLRVSGEVFGGLTTLDTFDRYHLKMDFRWGEKKWEPRLEAKRDSGILYHAHGEHGTIWEAWKSCLEYQVQETDLGDLIPLGGPRALVRGSVVEGRGPTRDPASDTLVPTVGYCHAAVEADAPHGEWNTLELFVVGADAIHVVNGEVVFVVQDTVDGRGEPLTSGQIQLQSEAAECFYRGIEITPIDAFPADHAGLVRPAGG